ncbi:vWA domain-containing protein [Candidatus Protofrankia californiensis]|uniref:vWA domain-containing protein n=1 Tax=Candidatus Protofrankia californiensis TaxID=1839754 RepID=UPI0010411584|nr:VWA domain-containing protein [Candidatus Protofrankia californiensis]
MTTPFTVEVFQNEYLAYGHGEVHAVVTVRGAHGPVGPPSQSGPAELAEVIMLDCSGSMAAPQTKIIEMRRAANAAVDALPDGMWFAIVQGSGIAEAVYPTRSELVQADKRTRAAAKAEIGRLEPDGGTAIGRWLTRTRELMATRPNAIHHAILLTDGQNGERTSEFDEAVAACVGRFQCDCRGVGADWRVDELRHIATALLGTVDAVRRPQDLAADFRSMIDTATNRAVDRVSLRVWTPRNASVRFLRQVAPHVEDLTGTAVRVNELTVDYPTGAWGSESRDYHLCVTVPAREDDVEMLAARVNVVVADQVWCRERVRAIWTKDIDLSTRIAPEVAHYTDQTELAQALQEGLQARRVGDEVTATIKLGRSAQLAHQSGNESTYRLLQHVVDIEDPSTGTVRLKRNVDTIDEMILDTRSTRTVRVNR